MRNEENILNRCVERVRLLPPVQKVIIQNIEKKINDLIVDAVIEIVTEKSRIQFIVEVKSILKRPIPNQLYLINNNINNNFILFSEYINPSIAEDLKRKQLNFIDCQGNAFIHIPDQLYVDIQGNKYKSIEEKRTTTIFQPKGMQLLSLLLTKERIINFSFRELARISGNSLGKIATIMKELKNNGYILNSQEGKYLIADKKLIFNRWLENYGERLRPKLLIGTYRISTQTDYSQIAKALQNEKFAFGGTVAAEIITNYIEANCIDLFIPVSDTMNVINKLKLAPAKDYNIRLFNLFSKELIDLSYQYPIILPILVYAELLYQNNDRARETAQMIYEDHIRKLLQ